MVSKIASYSPYTSLGNFGKSAILPSLYLLKSMSLAMSVPPQSLMIHYMDKQGFEEDFN